MASIKQIVEETDHPAGRAFDLFVQFFILLSLTAFTLETIPGLPRWQRVVLHRFELLSVGVFTVEYLLRLAVADRKLAFVTSFFGVVDLIAVLPFYLSFGIDLRSLRIVRLIRLVWVLKLVRYNAALRRFHRAILLAREELVLFGFACVGAIYLAAVGIYIFEHHAQPTDFGSVPQCLWWSVVTLTTVGYGDVVPVTGGGRGFTALVLFVGLSLVSVPPGLIASALGRAREMEDA